MSTSGQSECALLESPALGAISAHLTCIPGSTESLPSVSLSDLFLVFHPAAHALDLGPSSSIISLTIPLISQSPAVFHAMISCSSIFIAQTQPSWQPVAIRHYCKALHSLAQEMTESNMRNPAVVTSSMAVVMMLHMFQVCARLRFEASLTWMVLRRSNYSLSTGV